MSSTTNYQFIQTRNLFREYLSNYPTKPTYEEWFNAEEDDKASLLFVTFYHEVTMAWYKAVVANGIIYLTQEDGVSIIMQYLMKNVEKINNDPKRYTGSYIYQVCYKCLLSLWGSHTADRERCDSEISNEYMDGDVSVNLWDLVPSNDEDYETQQTKEAIWNIIRHMGPKAEKVVNHLINPSDTLNKTSMKAAARSMDRLADVFVTEEEYAEILAELRVKLAPYKDILLSI